MFTATEERTDVQKQIDDGVLGKHLICNYCHPESAEGVESIAICGAKHTPTGTIYRSQAKQSAMHCPLCMLLIDDHGKEQCDV